MANPAARSRHEAFTSRTEAEFSWKASAHRAGFSGENDTPENRGDKCCPNPPRESRRDSAPATGWQTPPRAAGTKPSPRARKLNFRGRLQRIAQDFPVKMTRQKIAEINVVQILLVNLAAIARPRQDGK